MANAPDRPRLLHLDERGAGIHCNGLVWAWLPATDEPTPGVFFKTDPESELWVNWDLNGGEIHAEEGIETASGSNDSAVRWEDC